MKNGMTALLLAALAFLAPFFAQGAAFAASGEDTPAPGLYGEHVRLITDVNSAPMEIEKTDPVTGQRSIRTVRGSDYIPVNSTDFVQMICGHASGSYSLVGGEFYLYFYDQDLNINWDILDHTDEATGERNRVSIEYLKALNGFQFTGIPDGSYVRLAPANGYECRLLIWDGCQTGYPVSGLTTVFNADGEKERLPADGSACIQVPVTAVYLIAKPGYTFLSMTTSNTEVTEPVSHPECRFPAQVIHLRGFGGAGRAKNIRIAAGYDYTTGSFSRVMPNTDLSDSVIVLDDAHYQPVSLSNPQLDPVMQNIRNCMDFTWTATADIVDCWGPDGTSDGVPGVFRKGVTYHGIPYRSGWSTPIYVGWHVSKQTFMNAANDPDSIFYHHKSTANPGPYYSLVCSSFGALVSGFPYPMTNYSMMKDPQLLVTRTEEPVIGGLMSNGIGHCFIPVARSVSADKPPVLTLSEQVGPLTACRNVFQGISKSWKGIGLKSTYPSEFVYHVSAGSFSPIPYDISTYTIKNGSARPHRGDQSVYTSAMSVLVNIKDPDATRLYYQKFDVVCDHGVPVSVSPCQSPQYVDIAPGTTQVMLRSSTSGSGAFTGVPLEGSTVYGVWASRGNEQPSAPNNTEFFEWHDLAAETITYQIRDGVLVTDDEFWYAVAMATNETDYVKANHKSGLISIPYQLPVRSEGETEAHSDYSSYAERARITSDRPVWAFFRKGVFGAYVTGLTLAEG